MVVIGFWVGYMNIEVIVLRSVDFEVFFYRVWMGIYCLYGCYWCILECVFCSRSNFKSVIVDLWVFCDLGERKLYLIDRYWMGIFGMEGNCNVEVEFCN